MELLASLSATNSERWTNHSGRVHMGKFAPTKQHGDCEEIAHPSTAYGRRRRNWTDAHGRLHKATLNRTYADFSRSGSLLLVRD